MGEPTPAELARSVLRAVLPIVEARVRAEVAEEIAQDLESPTDMSDRAQDPAVLREREICIAVVRSHATREDT